MNSVKILHCADLHIGAAESFLGSRAESRKAETLITFEKIINLARENAVDILLIAGDLFNSNNVEKTYVDRVFECFAAIPETKIVFSAGNHDPLTADSPFKKYASAVPKNVYVMDTKDSCIRFDGLNTCVYGKSFKEVYMQGSPEFSLKAQDGCINIMCIHGEVRADLGSDYNSITNGFIQSSGMNYIALGHVHKRTNVDKIGNSYCAYCGCPEGQGFDELGEKGVYLGEVSMHDCKLEFIPTAKRMHICESVDISGLLTSNEIATRIIDTVKLKYTDCYTDNLYKIILTGYVDEAAEISVPEITSRLNEMLYFAKVKNKTEFKINFDELAKEPTLKGIFVKNMLAKIEAAQETEKELLRAALNLGIKAFTGEVSYDED